MTHSFCSNFRFTKVRRTKRRLYDIKTDFYIKRKKGSLYVCLLPFIQTYQPVFILTVSKEGSDMYVCHEGYLPLSDKGKGTPTGTVDGTCYLTPPSLGPGQR